MQIFEKFIRIKHLNWGGKKKKKKVLSKTSVTDFKR